MGELGDIARSSPSEQPVRGLKMESSAYSISKATVADAKDVVDYCNKVGGETHHLSFGAGGYHRDEEGEARFLREHEESGSGVVVVARSDVSGEVAGASAAISRGRRSKHVFVVSVTVAREHWRRGLGGRMMRRLEEEVRLLKGSKLCLVVGADNPSAIALYRKMGYREEGRLEGEVLLPTGEVIDLIAMAKFI